MKTGVRGSAPERWPAYTGMSVLVDCVHLDETYLRKKRAESAARVKKLNGHLQLEQMAKRAQEQRDSDDGWQD